MSKVKKDAKEIPESYELDKSKLTDALKKPVKAIVDGFAHAGASAAGHAIPQPPKPQAPAPVKKVDPKTRLPGTLMEKGSMKNLVDKSKNLATALEQKTMKKNDQEWVNKMAKCMALKKDDAKTGATPPPVINSDAGRQISQSFTNATGTSGIMQGIKNVGSALGFGKSEHIEKGGDFTQINSEPILQRNESKWDGMHLKKLHNRLKMHVGKALSASEEMKKDGASPPPPNQGAQSAQASMRQAFHFGKAENPDMKQDAKLGEDVEHLVEDHMVENKDAEQKEGHKIMKKCDDPKFLKQLHGSLKKMYGVEMTEKVEFKQMGKPLMPAHNSDKGGETQDQKHSNDLNKRPVEKAETLKKPYVSEAQRGFFHTATARKQGITPGMTKEWDKKSKGLKLPKKK